MSHANSTINNKIIICCGFWPADPVEYIKSFETDPLLNFLVSNDFSPYSTQTLEQAKQLVQQHKPAILLVNIDPFDKLKLRLFFFPLIQKQNFGRTLLTVYTKHTSASLRISWHHWGITHIFDPSISPEELVARCEASCKLMI